MAETLFHKVWNAHAVRRLPSGQTQLFVGLHLVHEVTTPQAFDMLRQHGWHVAYPNRTFGTIDHIVPTSSQKRPLQSLASAMNFSRFVAPSSQNSRTTAASLAPGRSTVPTRTM